MASAGILTSNHDTNIHGGLSSSLSSGLFDSGGSTSSLRLSNGQSLRQDGLEVTESGKALKVHSDRPHLVSLGSGRLSTSVTLLPLPEGKIHLGTIDAPTPQDIVIQGTGVESRHCFIENIGGIVTLHPLAAMTTIDGLQVTAPTRLSQGSMICLGRSNYFRFNHPQEAQLMKSVLPNTRISMVPFNFSQGLENPEYFHMAGTPTSTTSPMSTEYNNLKNTSGCSAPVCSPNSQAGGKSPYRDSLESEAFGEKVSKFEYLSHYHRQPVSPESNLWLVRSPPSPLSPTFNSPTSPKSFQSDDVPIISSYVPRRNGSVGKPPTTPTKVGPPVAPKPTTPTLSSPTSSICSPITPTPHTASAMMSPKFMSLTKIDPQISPKVFVPMLTSPPSSKPSQKLPRHRPGQCSPAYHRQNGLGQHCSLEDLQNCEHKLEQHHQKMMKERILEQEMEKQERQRLEEILNMCAEYERQTQREKSARKNQEELSNSQSNPPNVDLRDGQREITKHSSVSSNQPGNNSPGAINRQLGNSSPVPSTTHPLQMNRIKTNGSLPRDRVMRIPSPEHGMRKPIKSTSSEDELNRIFSYEPAASPTSPSTSNSSSGQSSESTDTKHPPALVLQQMPNATSNSAYSTYPQSPRTRIKTVVSRDKEAANKDDEIYENRLAISEFHLSNKRNVPSSQQQENLDGMKSNERLVLQQSRPANDSPNSPSSAFDVFLPEHDQVVTNQCESTISMKISNSPQDLTVLQKQKDSFLGHLSDIRHKAADMETQFDETLRSLEIERALLEGESQALLEKQRECQVALNALKQKECELIEGVELARGKEHANIDAARKRLEGVEHLLHQLECSLDKYAEGSNEREEQLQKVKAQHEVVDSERKTFEDLEFQQLEHDAHREEEKEQIARRQHDLIEEANALQIEIQEIENQKAEMALQEKREKHLAEAERIKLSAEYKKDKERLDAIEALLKDISSDGANNSSGESSPRSSNGENDVSEGSKSNGGLQMCNLQVNGISNDKMSVNLIHQVTSRSPILTKDGKSSAALQEIEKNRQLILEKQGNMVIEEERKRVQELKKKAADEGRAQWEERKQREANCSSFNSMESEVSSITSSDIPPESVSSEEYEKLLVADQEGYPGLLEDATRALECKRKVRQKEMDMRDRLEETRPLSDSSSQDDFDIRFRDKRFLQLQRPLTRYLPIRSDDLNLRQHVESAGHQIELCPHIHITSSSCRGYLHKFGTKFRNCNKRWFVFDRSQRMLLYYADKSEVRPRGAIYFQYIVEVYVDHLHAAKTSNPKLTFCVKTLDRSYYLVAPTVEAMRIWVDVIFTGAEGYQEFQLES